MSPRRKSNPCRASIGSTGGLQCSERRGKAKIALPRRTGRFRRPFVSSNKFRMGVTGLPQPQVPVFRGFAPARTLIPPIFTAVTQFRDVRTDRRTARESRFPGVFMQIEDLPDPLQTAHFRDGRPVTPIQNCRIGETSAKRICADKLTRCDACLHRLWRLILHSVCSPLPSPPSGEPAAPGPHRDRRSSR